MIDAGAKLAAWWTEGAPQPRAGFVERFAGVPERELAAILDDKTIALVLIACRPDQRADLAIAAMHAGKEVMTDKPGCISLDEVARLRAVVADTGRIWSVNFSERFEVAAVTEATRLVRAGAINKVVQTVGLGPYRLNPATRPEWSFAPTTYGGILIDIASHQIEQFLHFTGGEDAEIALASVGNFANHMMPQLEDFGEISLRSAYAQGYIRVDWYTSGALPNWGDGRLFIVGTKDRIELRKYVDMAGRPGTDHLFLVNRDRCEHTDCTNAPLPYFNDFSEDIRNRSETACPQARTFRVCELAIEAPQIAVRRGFLSHPPYRPPSRCTASHSTRQSPVSSSDALVAPTSSPL